MAHAVLVALTVLTVTVPRAVIDAFDRWRLRRTVRVFRRRERRAFRRDVLRDIEAVTAHSDRYPDDVFVRGICGFQPGHLDR